MKKMNKRELHFSKKNILPSSWREIIETISKYEPLLRTWKIEVTLINHELHYFTYTRAKLPPRLVGIDECVLKECEKANKNRAHIGLPKFVNPTDSIIDIAACLEIKKHIESISFEIDILPIRKNLYRAICYLITGNRKRPLTFALPENLLSVDFAKNSNFLYKKTPKYLDITKVLHLLKSDSQNSVFQVDTFPYLQGSYYLGLNNFSFDKHSLLVGSSGSGKSKLLSLIIKNLSDNIDYKMKYKVIVIDPHASIEDDVGGLENTKIIDFKNDQSSIDIFKNGVTTNTISSTEMMLDIFKNLIANYNPKTERLLRHSINLLLNIEKFTFKNLRSLLLDTEFRVGIIENDYSITENIKRFFLQDFNELKTKSYNESIAPIIAFIDEMQMLPVFNKDADLDSLLNAVNSNFLTIFSLDPENLGNSMIRTISGLIMKLVFELAESKAVNEHIILIIDEISVVENPVLNRILSEARKYGLSLILAEQYFDQVSDSLKNAIFSNTLNYYLFRLSKKDATLLSESITIKLPTSDTEKDKIDLLTNLNDRECITRITEKGILFPAFKAKTVDFKTTPRKRLVPISPDIKPNTHSVEAPGKKFLAVSSVSLNTLLMDQSSSREEIGGKKI